MLLSATTNVCQSFEHVNKRVRTDEQNHIIMVGESSDTNHTGIKILLLIYVFNYLNSLTNFIMNIANLCLTLHSGQCFRAIGQASYQKTREGYFCDISVLLLLKQSV